MSQSMLTPTILPEGPSQGQVAPHLVNLAEITTDNPIPRTEIFEVPVAIAPINYPEGGIYKVKVLAQNEPIGERDLTVRSLAAV
jgi:hypothetical protein